MMAEPSNEPQPSPLRVALLLEQHLGHGTYADNLRAEAETDAGIDATWSPVDYAVPTRGLGRMITKGRYGGALAARSRIRASLRRDRADAWVFNTQVPAVLAGRRLRKPYVVVTDVTPKQYDRVSEGYGHRADRPGPVAWLKHRINTRVFNEAAWCVPWSSWVATSLVDDYGVPESRIAVIPPGVDIGSWSRERREPGGEPFRVLFVGGDFERKGGDVLLEAMDALSDSAELYLVTKSSVTPSERVHVIDDLGPNDPRLIELFHRADAFALPSRAETFGIAAVEASAAGLPVVASRVGGLADIVVDGETGFVTPPGDAAALGSALGRLERDADLRQRLGDAARQRAIEHYDAATNANRLFELVRAASLATRTP
jgi:glycosyltransferase involved in cell wall biosynthesis